MEVTAKARYIRMSPRKVRLVAGLVRGADVARAEAQLGLLNKAAALPVLKLLRSAIANAEHNNKLEREGLFIKSITVDGGPVLRRWRPRAFGRAAPIRKRTSHITIVLADQKPDGQKPSTGLKAAVVKKAAKKEASAKPAADQKAAKKADQKDQKATAKPAADQKAAKKADGQADKGKKDKKSKE